MGRRRQKRVRLDAKAVLGYRAQGWSYERIGRHYGVSASAVWYAERRERKLPRARPPAGAPRTVYLPDEAWALLAMWAQEAVPRCSRSRLIADLVAAERERRGEPEPVIPGAETA